MRFGVVGRLLGGDAAAVHEVLHIGVVRGHLGEDAAAQQVGPRVPNVHHAELVVGAEQRHARGAEAGEGRVLLTALHQLVVRVLDGVPQEVEQVVDGVDVVVEGGEVGHGHGGGDVPTGGSAHAVREDEQVGAGVPGVLVRGPDEPDVGARGVVELDGHRRSSRTVCPMRTSVPGARGVGSLMVRPATVVPLVEPRSSIIHESPWGKKRAWREDA